MAEYWQCDKTSSNQRLQHLKKNPTFADVVFKFGEQQVEAHSQILSMTSPVFERRLIYEMSSTKRGKKILTIDDTDFATFCMLLSYMYGDDLQLPNNTEATKLHKAADMYMIDDLKTKCINHICQTIKHDDAMTVLDYAVMNCNDILKARAFVIINSQIAAVLSSPDLRQVSLATIKVLLTEGAFNIRDFQLFRNLLDWSKEYLKELPELGDGDHQIRDMRWLWETNGFFKRVGFQRMDTPEFLSCCKLTDIFSYEESFQILAVVTGHEKELPKCLTAQSSEYKDWMCLGRLSLDVDMNTAKFRSDFSCNINLRSTSKLKFLGFDSKLVGTLKVTVDGTVVYDDNRKDRFTNGSVQCNFNKMIRIEPNTRYELTFKYTSQPQYTKLDASVYKCTSKAFTEKQYDMIFGSAVVTAEVTGYAPYYIKLLFIQ